jgi:glutathionyl-hydroquinone reductase
MYTSLPINTRISLHQNAVSWNRNCWITLRYYKIVISYYQHNQFIMSYTCVATCFDHQVVILRSLRYIHWTLQLQLKLWEVRLQSQSFALQYACQYKYVKGTKYVRPLYVQEKSEGVRSIKYSPKGIQLCLSYISIT